MAIRRDVLLTGAGIKRQSAAVCPANLARDRRVRLEYRADAQPRRIDRHSLCSRVIARLRARPTFRALPSESLMVTKIVRALAATSVGLFMTGTIQAADPVHGKAVFSLWCQGCHEPLPGHGYAPPAGSFVLQRRYQDSLPSALEQRTDLTAAFVRTMVRSGRNMMPPTRKSEVSDAELDDLAAYLSHSDR